MEKTLNSRLGTFLPFQIVTVSVHCSLYTQCLWLSVKTIKRIKRPNLWLSPQLYETRVVQHTFCRAGYFENQESSLRTWVPLLWMCCLISTGIWSTKEFQVSVHLSKKKIMQGIGLWVLQLHSLQKHKPILVRPCHQLWSVTCKLSEDCRTLSDRIFICIYKCFLIPTVSTWIYYLSVLIAS